MYRHPSPPPGVSMIAFTTTPDGDYRLRAEGNLTTCLYGPHAAAGSLEPHELPQAADALLRAVHGVVEGPLPEPDLWDLHRLDPSRTVLLPRDLAPSDAIGSALSAWSIRCNTRQVVSRHNASTVTFRRSKWQSWSVYDKTLEARARGHDVPDGLLRLEARIRPRVGSGAWHDLRPTLALRPRDLEMISMELDALTEDLVLRLAGTTTVGMARAMTRGGASPSAALRLAAAALVLQAHGPRALTDLLGVDDRTARRWRADAARFYEAGGGADAHEADGQALVPVLARDLADEAAHLEGDGS